jgi:hypothetical protein
MTEDKMTTFIYNEGGSLYPNFLKISKRLQELTISQKVASTEAYQVFTPSTPHKTAHS